MTYSCAVFQSPDDTLEVAQRRKVDLVARKLDLQPGMRLLDVGCGWGAMAIHAAREYGASAVGVTLSEPQRRYATEQAKLAGVSDLVEFRLQDFRDVKDGPFDAISSIGMSSTWDVVHSPPTLSASSTCSSPAVGSSTTPLVAGVLRSRSPAFQGLRTQSPDADRPGYARSLQDRQ